jgi:hypothetical protein
VQTRGRVRRLAVRIVTDEYLDLYVLGVSALTFTILGVAGFADVKVLASVTLALLAVLAFSQIRSRRHIADIAGAQRSEPLAFFRTDFPDELESMRGSASSLLLIGVSMTRTVQAGSMTGLKQMLRSGGKVRVLVLDPTEEVLVRAAGDRRPHGTVEWLKRRIEFTLEELVNLREATSGDVEIRVARFVPSMGINVIDVGSADGLIVLQHYEHRPVGEPAPILTLGPGEGFWYEHFTAEAERLWQDGTPWPLSPAETLRRSARPLFKEEFGPELEQTMSRARELLITGVTRNTLFTSKYSWFEDSLTKGCSIRVMLIDPSCDAIVVAAERYYAERSSESTRNRINQTLRILAELKRSTGGDLSARLTAHPLAMGAIAVDARPGIRAEATALFAEYYTYQARGEPKFVLQPTDGQWFENLYQEAEALWAGASVVNLDSLT